MDTKNQAAVLNVEDELRKLREKSDRGELMELKRGPFGGYNTKEVKQYVSRLKEQLQTAERTFKSHIAELAGEKDMLKAERDALQLKLSRYEAAAQGKERQAPDESAAGIHTQAAMDPKPALQARFAEQAEDYGMKAEEFSLRTGELEERLAAEQNAAEELERKLEDADRKIERLAEEGRQMRSQLSDERQENCRLNVQSENLKREIDGLSTQLGVAKQNILRLISDKEALDGIISQLKDALNGLMLKADALMRENSLVSSQLEAERAKMQQYQTMHDKLSDMLSKVRTAGQMLDERVVELDKALSWGEGQMSRSRVEAPRRVTKAELLDFSAGKSSAVQDMVNELGVIQANMAQMQQPMTFVEEPEGLLAGELADDAYSTLASSGR